MKYKSVECGIGDGAVFKIRENLYAIVFTKSKRVYVRPYWLNLAKGYAVYHPDFAIKENIEKAKKIIESFDDDGMARSVESHNIPDKLKWFYDGQEKILAESKKKQKGIHL